MQLTHIRTNDSLMELSEHGSDDFPFQYYYEDILKYDIGYIDWHWHREFECITVREGAVRCGLGNESIVLREGEGIYINSGILHRIEALETGVIANILFAPSFIAPENTRIYTEFVAPLLCSGISNLPLRHSLPWQSQLLEKLSRIYRLCENGKTGWQLEAHALICEGWALVFRNRDMTDRVPGTDVSRTTQARLQRMTHFIQRHYSVKLSLEQIAASAGISKSEALRCFKNGMQTSPIRYLNHYRLRKAHSLLCSAGRTVTDVAEAVGFESVSYFDRLYKREFHMTPRERKNAPD